MWKFYWNYCNKPKILLFKINNGGKKEHQQSEFINKAVEIECVYRIFFDGHHDDYTQIIMITKLFYEME